ncbi:MAG: SufE family protein [bacterium]
MPHPPKIAQFLEDLSLFPDRQDKIQVLISLATKFKPFDAPHPYPEDHRVPGCESEAYGWTVLEDGKLRLEFVVDNPQGISAKAMAALLKEGLDGEPMETAFMLDEELVYEVFGRELSMGKSGGLMNMISLVKSQAAKL